MKTLLMVFACTFLFTTVATAQSVRTWVSAAGIDNPLCSRTEPCRTFGAAMAVVNSGGEVVVLDSGGYGPFTITKSVSIVSPLGVHAAIAPTNGIAINIEAGASDRVVLRGLYLSSQGAQRGIEFRTGLALHIEHCVISGFSQYGLVLHRNLTSDTAEIFVSDSILRENTFGLDLSSTESSSLVIALVERTLFEGNASTAFRIHEQVRATARNTVVARNGGGFMANSATASLNAELNLDHCTAVHNLGTGITAGGAGGPSIVRLTNSMAANNPTGIFIGSGGQVYSIGSSLVYGNGTDVVGVIGTIPGT